MERLTPGFQCKCRKPIAQRGRRQGEAGVVPSAGIAKHAQLAPGSWARQLRTSWSHELLCKIIVPRGIYFIFAFILQMRQPAQGPCSCETLAAWSQAKSSTPLQHIDFIYSYRLPSSQNPDRPTNDLSASCFCHRGDQTPETYPIAQVNSLV